MDQDAPKALSELTGLWRVDGVSQANWDANRLKVGVVLSELKPELENYYSADARQPKEPKQILLNPHWLSWLTVGSIWSSGERVYKPSPLPGLFQVDTRKAEVHSFDRGVKLGERYTRNGIADPDFLDRNIHRDLIASPYVLAPIQGNKQFKWMVIPCSEVLRFYMGQEMRLIAKVVRGELDTLIEKVDVTGETVTIYEKVALSRIEAIILARAYANKESYLSEIQSVFQRLRKISTTNRNTGTMAALSIKALFPINDITNLSISGVPISLAGDLNNALFAMEIFSCTSPNGYSNIIIKRANDIGASGDNKVPGKCPSFAPQENDDIEDTILDEQSDPRIPKKNFLRYATPFPWSESVSIEYRRDNNPRAWRTEGPRLHVDVEAYALDDDSYEGSYKGNQGAHDVIKTPPPPSIELSKFIEILPDLESGLTRKNWSISTITPNEEILSSNKKYTLSNFPKIKGKRWKWHLVTPENNKIKSTTRRQVACIEAKHLNHPDHYFYILEMERKDDAHCTALLRTQDFKKLDMITINNFLKLTSYNNGWPEFNKPLKNDSAQRASTKLQSDYQFLVGKSRHPNNRENWASSLLTDITKWIENTL